MKFLYITIIISIFLSVLSTAQIVIANEESEETLFNIVGTVAESQAELRKDLRELFEKAKEKLKELKESRERQNKINKSNENGEDNQEGSGNHDEQKDFSPVDYPDVPEAPQLWEEPKEGSGTDVQNEIKLIKEESGATNEGSDANNEEGSGNHDEQKDFSPADYPDVPEAPQPWKERNEDSGTDVQNEEGGTN